jgi:hypothetical protein
MQEYRIKIPRRNARMGHHDIMKLEMEQLWDRLRSRDRIIEELKKKNYKMLLDVEQLQKENHNLKEELSKSNSERKREIKIQFREKKRNQNPIQREKENPTARPAITAGA